jgi:arabinan endo-1,5-alpha-L-arabinosidase
METGTWKDLGAVVASKGGEVYNASEYKLLSDNTVAAEGGGGLLVDGNLFNDNGALKLSFGSWTGGLFQIGLWPNVNDPASVILHCGFVYLIPS